MQTLINDWANTKKKKIKSLIVETLNSRYTIEELVKGCTNYDLLYACFVSNPHDDFITYALINRKTYFVKRIIDNSYKLKYTFGEESIAIDHKDEEVKHTLNNIYAILTHCSKYPKGLSAYIKLSAAVAPYVCIKMNTPIRTFIHAMHSSAGVVYVNGSTVSAYVDDLYKVKSR